MVAIISALTVNRVTLLPRNTLSRINREPVFVFQHETFQEIACFLALCAKLA